MTSRAPLLLLLTLTLACASSRNTAPPPTEESLNAAGYKLLGEGRIHEAIDTFRRVTAAYPQSVNAWDSLAEAYLAAKQNDKAIELYRKVFAMTPTDERVRGILRDLGVTYSEDQLAAMLRTVMPDDVELLPNVAYGEGSGRPLLLHLVRPRAAASAPRPALLFIHGGGWTDGSKERGLIALLDFVRHGYVAASLGYRLSGEAKFPAQIDDVQTAIRFLRANAATYGIDPHRIAVWGQSAGGHLAALAGTSGEGSSRPDAVIDWNGPTDFLEPRELARILAQKQQQGWPTIAMERLLGGDVEAHRELAEKANPIRYVSPDDPPFLILHGTADDTVDISQSRALVDALQAAGVDVTFRTYEGHKHFGIHPVRPAQQPYLGEMLAWLDAKFGVRP